MPKTTYNNDKSLQFEQGQKILAAYIPNLEIDKSVYEGLESTPFTRVFYISRFGKPNRTPRYTWAYGKVREDKVSYKGLNFKVEEMPEWLNDLALQCREISKTQFNFDPEYNSCIIGKYNDGNDQIGFHFDTETFLTHHFCANVTIGTPRDFQFKTVDSKNEKHTHEIKLGDKSVFFFLGLEHALPKRAGVKKGDIRYSISFRNMKNDIGIGNSYYYCRGLDGAIDDDDKATYQINLEELRTF